MYGVDGQRPLDFDRTSRFDVDSGCHGGGNKIDTDSNRTSVPDFFGGQTRKASPFDEVSGNPPMLTSYVPKTKNTSEGSADSELKDVLRKLINWLSNSRKTDNADGTSSTGETQANTTENGSEKQLLAMVLVLLVLDMQGRNSPGTRETGLTLDSLADNLEKSAAGSNMDPGLLSLLKEILAMLTGKSDAGRSQSETKSLIDKLFDNNAATAEMDPSLVSMLKELLTLLLSRKDEGKSGSTDRVADGSRSEATDRNRSDSSLEDMLADLLGNSPATANLDPELRSFVDELITSLLGVSPDTSSKTDESGNRETDTRQTRTVSPEHSSTTKVAPSSDGEKKTTATSTEKSDLSDKGNVITVNEPIVVDGGVFDGKGATYTASSKLGDGGQSESQSPVFILKNGATLKNVDLGENGADGIHVYGGATLENVNWQNVGEDALTVKSAGDVTIIGGSAKGATDKIFQINADTHFYLKDFAADGFTTLVRTNGGKQIDADVIIDGGSFANGTNLFRTDSSLASVSFQSDIALDNVRNWTRVGDKQSGV
ncbi:pectate lyase [Rhizobium sp. M10]|uniref:pectate lyase n=1 Tax=Rhizobium sp. M10 TaxID=1324586 RepID=UPI001FE21313|nr:pectate lyase [Rhizobium sp. M10]